MTILQAKQTKQEIKIFSAEEDKKRLAVVGKKNLLAAQKWRQSMRKRRSDVGNIMVTTRDTLLLKWIHDQYAVRFDHLHELINRYAGRSTTTANAQYLVHRWRKAGWVEQRKILADNPYWIWLSKAGKRFFSLPFSYRKPSLSMLNHYHKVSAVRLRVEERDYQWEPERTLKAQFKRRRKPHVVDGEACKNQEVIGIEVELSAKSKQRTKTIINDLARKYVTVWYFVNQRSFKIVRGALETHPQRDRFKLYRLSSIPLVE